LTPKKEKILVTSALPYANGPLHLGHLAGAYLPADIFVRYHRLKGNDIIHVCGSDEHGVPITLQAERQGVSPQEIVDQFHQRNKDAFEAFGIAFDHYSRTTLPIHYETAQEFFLNLYRKDVFRKKTEKQLYDQEKQMFLPDRYVVGTCPVCEYDNAYGDQCERCGSALSPMELIHPKSVLTGTQPVVRETTHWYLPLGDLQPQLEKWILSKKNWKPNVFSQVKAWLDQGLSDRAVTRDLHWGVPVPLEEAEGKVLYVWFEAPIGYISATKDWAEQKGNPELWKEYWQNKETKLYHFIGKDNIVFHCIIFPAMLMVHGDYVLPENVPANEFLNLEGRKLSTSRGYAVWLEEYLQKFPPDPLRYTLASTLPETKDSDFSWKDFQTRNNSELADILGNFANRTLTFARRNFDGQVPRAYELDDLDRRMLGRLSDAAARVGGFIERFEFRRATREVMDIARDANKYFNDQEPWRTLGEDPQKCATTIHICIRTCKTLAVLMQPVLPFSAAKLWKMLALPGRVDEQAWDQAAEFPVEAGYRLGRPEILFEKIEDSAIEPEIEKLQAAARELDEGGGVQTPVTDEHEEKMELISFKEFQRLDLRIATVENAEAVKGADKLLRLEIELGGEKRQIVAGIAQHYKPEELLGKRIVVVANLEPATIRGVESQGMLLAAEDEEGRLRLLTPDGEIASGARVR
jgi:methionyl-tRNA synthetase